MKKFFKLLGIIALTAVIGFSMITCSDDKGDGDGSGSNAGDGVPPENKPAKDRWWKWGDSATAKMSFSVDDDGVCTITVSGTPDKDPWGQAAAYSYTAKAGTRNAYTFEAWTKTGTRDLHFQYCTDNDEQVYLSETITITSERKTYTVYGQALSKGVEDHLDILCADQIGIFYIKILEIKEYTTGLTITGLGDYNGKYVIGINIGSSFLIAAASIDNNFDTITGGKISGGSVTLNVWDLNVWGYSDLPPTNYTGNDTVEFSIYISNSSADLFSDTVGYGYVAVTFKNGAASGKFTETSTSPGGDQTIITITDFAAANEDYYGYIILSLTRNVDDAVAYGAAARKIFEGELLNEMVDKYGSVYGENKDVFIIIGIGVTAADAQASALAGIGYVSDSKKAVYKGYCSFNLNTFSLVP